MDVQLSVELHTFSFSPCERLSGNKECGIKYGFLDLSSQMFSPPPPLYVPLFNKAAILNGLFVQLEEEKCSILIVMSTFLSVLGTFLFCMQQRKYRKNCLLDQH